MQRPLVPPFHLQEMHSPAPLCHLPSEAYVPNPQTCQERRGEGCEEGGRADCTSSDGYLPALWKLPLAGSGSPATGSHFIISHGGRMHGEEAARHESAP